MACAPLYPALGISLLAVLLPVLMLQIRVQLPIAFGERPLLVLFMLPIIVCALLGLVAWSALHPDHRPGHQLFHAPHLFTR